MAARPSKASTSSAKAESLRDALVRRAKRRFRVLFGVPYDDVWGAKVRKHRRALQKQDEAARKAAVDIRRTPNKVRRLVRAHGLEDHPYRPGTAPVLGILATISRRSTAEMKQWVLSEDPIAAERPYASLRSFLVVQFEVLPARSDRRGTFGDLARWKREGFNDARVLTDNELVGIMICVEPKFVKLSPADVSLGVARGLAVVLERERRAMKEAREKHGAVDRPLTSEGRKMEAQKSPLLPGF